MHILYVYKLELQYHIGWRLGTLAAICMGTLCTFGITVILDKVLKTMRFVQSRDEQHQHNRLKYIAHLNIILYIQIILNVSVLFPVH